MDLLYTFWRRSVSKGMEKQRSAAAYRNIDLMLWAAILIVFEGVIIRAARGFLFADQAFTVSLAGALTCIVYMRWGAWGGLHAALAGAVYAVMNGGGWKPLLIYIIGNLLSLVCVPLMNRAGREKVRTTLWLSMAAGLGTVLLMQLGRALTGLVLGVPLEGCIRYFTTDALSLVFTLVIVWIVRRLDGVFEDQRHYLSRFQKEQEKERMEQG